MAPVGVDGLGPVGAGADETAGGGGALGAVDGAVLGIIFS